MSQAIDRAKAELETAFKNLIESAYEDQGVKVDRFLYDPLWTRKDGVTIGRFQAADGSTYQFTKAKGSLEIAKEQ